MLQEYFHVLLKVSPVKKVHSKFYNTRLVGKYNVSAVETSVYSSVGDFELAAVFLQ